MHSSQIRSEAMTEKQRLIHTLFETDGRDHLNLKFFRGCSTNISPEDLSREANSAILQVELGLVKTHATFKDDKRSTVDVNTI
jgi:hypothetical protein